MTLRARLTLFFTGIVVVPLLAATLALQVLVSREIGGRTDTRLEVGARAVSVLWQERLEAADRELRRAAVRFGEDMDEPGLEAVVDGLRVEAELDFLVVTDVDGGIEAASLGSSEFLPGTVAPSPLEIASEGGSAEVLRSRAVLGDESLMATGGWYVDRDFLEVLAEAGGTAVVLVGDDGPVASSVMPVPEVPAGEAGIVAVGDGQRALATSIQGHRGQLVLVAEEERSILHTPLWAVAVVGLLLATVLAYLLAGVIVRPVNRLAEGARAVAEGRFDTRIEVGDRGDVGNVAESFNIMTDYVRRYIEELEDSRDELRRGLERLGTTLRSTHDLGGMLRVVLETAAATLGASSGTVFLMDPAGREMRLEVATGFEPSPVANLRVGQGIAGRAAEGRPVVVPSPTERTPPKAPVEPVSETAVAVPLVRGSRTIGVLALYGRPVSQPFTEEDVATLSSLAGQASVAIENVLLHREAQRLSITDGLTGLWNRRYLHMLLTKEIERAQRFSRPLSVLMLDIDHFKQVNDEHGHLAGDAVLVEISRRITSSLRSQIDSVARYGGEEFVVVLPETPPTGARVVAEKARAAMSSDAILVDDQTPPLRVTVSIGIASVPADGVTADDVLGAADTALYRAKREGRDRVEYSDASAASPRGNRL